MPLKPFKKKPKAEKKESAPKVAAPQPAEEKAEEPAMPEGAKRFAVTREIVRYWARKGLTASDVSEKFGISLSDTYRLGGKVFRR